MKPVPRLLLFLVLLAPLELLPAPAAAKQVYQSPMHPWITSDKPGRCTICGMPLVLVTVDEAGAQADSQTTSEGSAPLVTLTAAQHSVIGIQTAAVTRGALTRTLRVNGIIADDETRHRILAARVPGRVETLHINYVGAEVRAGEPLAELYSPEVLTAQRGYLEHLRAGEAFAATALAAARERLLELGLTEAEIRTLETTGKPSPTHTLRAPLSGTVVARSTYEGQYVAVNDRLFELCDLSQLWFLFDLYEPDLAWVALGQEVEVELPSLPGEVLRSPIAFIDPNLDPTTRTARARVVLDNAQRKLLRHQTATATLRATYADRLLVPRSAVLQHSGEPIVFVEDAPRRYAVRRISLGRIGHAHAEVIAGLVEGERVVVEGGLILDGQAQLALANAGSAHSQPPPHSTPDKKAAALEPLALAAADAARALADDDLAAYYRQLPALHEAAHAYLAAQPDDTLSVLLESLHDVLPTSRTPNQKVEDLAQFTAALTEGATLKAARDAFEPFSTAVADLFLAAKRNTTPHGNSSRHTTPRLHIFQCPMTPVLGTGRWLSRTAELRNPFFGELMLECGEELHP